MISFLTSIAIDEKGKGFCDENNFVDKFLYVLEEPLKVLYIASDLAFHEITMKYAKIFKEILLSEDMNISSFNVLDNETKDEALKLVKESNCIILAGGDPLIQNRFFKDIDLKDLLNGYRGVVLGISAGSMNSGRAVYFMPETKEQIEDREYGVYGSGLDITSKLIIPHFDMNLLEDQDFKPYLNILAKESFNREFILIPDGSFIFIKDKREWIFGKSYVINKGEIKKICDDNESVILI